MFSALKNAKCLDIPRPLGSAFGLLAILVVIAIQLSFLTVQLAQGLVYVFLMPMAPLALSWVVNHLYATPMGKVHVWAFQIYKRFSGIAFHSQSTRVDIKTALSEPDLNKGSHGSLSRGQNSAHGDVSIHSIACLMDNYCYLLVDNTGEPPFACCLIDASECVNVLVALSQIAVQQYGGKGYDKTPHIGEEAPNAAESGETSSNSHQRAAAASKKSASALQPRYGRDGKRDLDGFSDVLRLEAVLSTHRHWDHTYGNGGILQRVASCTRVYGGRKDEVPSCTHPLDDGDVVKVGNMRIMAISTPCHTRGSMVYKVKGMGGVRDALFTGDTLFTGGCGAPFEGNQHTMSRAFQRIWLESHSTSLLFPGHEYGEVLLPAFFNSHGGQPLPSHPDDFKTLTDRFWLTHRKRRYNRPALPSIPVSLDVEMSYNPYFNALHTAADTIANILRRQCLKYSSELGLRAAHRFTPSSQSPGGGASSSRSSHLHRKKNKLSPNSPSSTNQLSDAPLPCPPTIDPAVWKELPRELQEEAVISLRVEFGAMRAKTANHQSNLNGSSPLHYDAESDVSLDSGFYPNSSLATAAATTSDDYNSNRGIDLVASDVTIVRQSSSNDAPPGEGMGEGGNDLIGGAPVATLDDVSGDDFAQIGNGGLPVRQFEFGGAYQFEHTLEQLVEALSVLSAGGDRIKVKTLYRALTTLGTSSGTGMCMSKRRRHEETWRGMGDDEARVLIDAFNVPQQVLTTDYDQFHTSEESIVVEYAATLFTQVCDRTVVPPPSCFLSLCRRCKICPSFSNNSQQLRSSESQDSDNRSVSRSPDASPARSSSSSGKGGGSGLQQNAKTRVAPSSPLAGDSKSSSCVLPPLKNGNLTKEAKTTGKGAEDSGMEMAKL